VSEQERNFHNVIEFRNPDQPWPDNPEIPDFPPDDPIELDGEIDEDGWVGDNNYFDPPSAEDIDEQDGLMLRRQRLFRWAAQAVPPARNPDSSRMRGSGPGGVDHRLEEGVSSHKECLHECRHGRLERPLHVPGSRHKLLALGWPACKAAPR
jgi:hypothetical protein